MGSGERAGQEKGDLCAQPPTNLLRFPFQATSTYFQAILNVAEHGIPRYSHDDMNCEQKALATGPVLGGNAKYFFPVAAKGLFQEIWAFSILRFQPLPFVSVRSYSAVLTISYSSTVITAAKICTRFLLQRHQVIIKPMA